MIFNLLKKLVLISSFLVMSLLLPSNAEAIAKFDTTYQVYYKVENSGNTHVTFVISQKNNLSVVYATEFGISLNETRIGNLKVADEKVPITPTVTKNENQTIITFPFAKKVVGKDKIHNFVIEYDTPDIVTKQGNTWQIDIPRFESDENVTEQTAILNLPSDFPQPAYIDPKPDIVNGTTYYFSSKILANKSISAIFGKNQFYKGNLKFYLHNTLNSDAEKSITLPPNTPYQTVYYEKIDPKPSKIETDSDGNLLAFYDLKQNESIQINAKVFIKTDFLPRLNPSIKNYQYTNATKLWNYDHNIFTVPELKNLTSPKAIYDFVANKLKYDYQKISRDGTIRVPASESLKNFQTAICTDYTDLFVSIARKANIPARELEGLAISDNPELKPISLNQDVLHAWPEFYDQTKNLWIQVDPTWASTTRGLDYFNKLDFNHIVFAIHGQDSEQPLPAGSFKKEGDKSKDLNFEAIEEIVFPVGKLEFTEAQYNPRKTTLDVWNSTGVYFQGSVSVGETKLTNIFKEEIIVPPFGKKTIELASKPLSFLSGQDAEVIININDRDQLLRIRNKNLFQKSALFAVGGLILGVLTLLARSLLLRRRK